MIYFIELTDEPVSGLVDDLPNPEDTMEDLSNSTSDLTTDDIDQPLPADEASLPQSPVLTLIKSK